MANHNISPAVVTKLIVPGNPFIQITILIKCKYEYVNNYVLFERCVTIFDVMGSGS